MWSCRWLAAALILTAGVGMAGAQPHPATPDRWRPRWNVGDQWVIETTSRPITARIEDPDDTVKIRWQFLVRKQEALNGKTCFVLEVVATPDPSTQPRTILWIDAQTLTLRQLQTQVPVPGGFSTITESYDVGKDAPPSPVLGPLTALPIDLPVFAPGGKAVGEEQIYSYEAVSGPSGKRAPNDVGFTVEVRQAMKPIELDEKTKGLIPQQFTRDLAVKPLAEVHLKTADRSVRQIWQAGQPWPVFADNEATSARLVEVKPAAQPPKP